MDDQQKQDFVAAYEKALKNANEKDWASAQIKIRALEKRTQNTYIHTLIQDYSNALGFWNGVVSANPLARDLGHQAYRRVLATQIAVERAFEDRRNMYFQIGIGAAVGIFTLIQAVSSVVQIVHQINCPQK